MTDDKQTLEELMRLALSGDRQSYSQVLAASSRLLRPYLGKRVNNHSEVEDILQEILISIHKARHTYDGKRPYKPWLFAIAKFRLTDHFRKIYSDHLRYAENIEDNENNFTSNVTEIQFSYESIKEEINNLSGKQSQILHLMHSEGHTAKEVAKKMNMKESAVKVAAHRAYKVLREKLVG